MEQLSNRTFLKWSISQMEQFSNRTFLKWSNSQMEHFGLATLCHISRSQEQRNMACDVLPLDQGFLSIFCQLAACKVSDLLHGMTDLMCRAESLVCRKQIAGLLSALGNHTTSTQQMGGDIYKCERRALLHVSSRLPQVTTKPLFGRRINFQF